MVAHDLGMNLRDRSVEEPDTGESLLEHLFLADARQERQAAPRADRRVSSHIDTSGRASGPQGTMQEDSRRMRAELRRADAGPGLGPSYSIGRRKKVLRGAPTVLLPPARTHQTSLPNGTIPHFSVPPGTAPGTRGEGTVRMQILRSAPDAELRLFPQLRSHVAPTWCG